MHNQIVKSASSFLFNFKFIKVLPSTVKNQIQKNTQKQKFSNWKTVHFIDYLHECISIKHLFRQEIKKIQ